MRPAVKKSATTIIAYKGFDANWKCRDYQFKVGKSYTHDGPVELCASGFHACEEPLDCLNYYSVIDGNFAEVELNGVSDERENDTKRVGSSITVKAKLTLAELISAEFEWTQKTAPKENIVSGVHSKAVASGDSSKAVASGNYSTAACDTNGFACVAGIGGRVKGNAGSSLSLGYMDVNKCNRIAVAYVGENGIELGTWYRADETGAFVRDAGVR